MIERSMTYFKVRRFQKPNALRIRDTDYACLNGCLEYLPQITGIKQQANNN
jgi:hypothetical protein